MAYATGHTKQIALENARAALDTAAQQILNLKVALYAYERRGIFRADIDLEPTDTETRYIVYDALAAAGAIFECDALIGRARAIDPDDYDEEEARADRAGEHAYEMTRGA